LDWSRFVIIVGFLVGAVLLIAVVAAGGSGEKTEAPWSARMGDRGRLARAKLRGNGRWCAEDETFRSALGLGSTDPLIPMTRVVAESS